MHNILPDHIHKSVGLPFKGRSIKGLAVEVIHYLLSRGALRLIGPR